MAGLIEALARGALPWPHLPIALAEELPFNV
jgi:hypothetical protein